MSARKGVAQLPLGLVPVPAFDRAQFVASDCNREALSLVERWPEWPGRVALIHGPEGAGKSHLAAIWAERAGAAILEPVGLDPLTARDRAGTAGALVIDGADRVAGDPAAEPALMHLMTLMYERHGPVLLTARQPSRQWGVQLPDLASRVNGAIPVAIAAPDDALLEQVLAKQFADCQLDVQADTLAYVLARMERSFAGARDLVARVDAQSLATRRPVTIPLVRATMGWREQHHQPEGV